MKRREFVVTSSATVAVIAGCLGTPEAEVEEPVAAAGTPTELDGEPTTYNYRASGADATGEAGDRLLNSVETAPVTQTAVWIPEDDQEAGYVNVHSVGPWTATVEAA